MPDFCSSGAVRLACHGGLTLPLLLSLWMAGMDLAWRRIPNYLTLGGAVAGLGFQLGSRGWPGLLDGLSGAVLGFLLLLWPYLKGGMGAGDVKGLAALGTWLGLEHTLYLFIYMSLAGGLIIIAVLIWQGRFRTQMRRGSSQLLNWVLCQSRLAVPRVQARGVKIPYGAALALGMAFLCGRQLWFS